MSKSLDAATLSVIANKTNHWIVDFVEVVLDNTDDTKTLRLSTHIHDVVIGGDTYSPAGQLLDVSTTTDTLQATENDLSLTLSGIDGAITADVLNNKPAGSAITLYRGFFDEDTGTMFAEPYEVWSGIGTSYGIEDTYDMDHDDSVAIQLTCRSTLSSIMQRQRGIYTSQPSLATIDDTDYSFEFVAGLKDKNFNFGKED